MHKVPYFWAIMSLLTGCGSANKSRGGYKLMGNWQQNPVIANGKDEEWEKPLNYSNTHEKLFYSVTNDEVNLYVLLKTSSDPLQSKILQTGLTIWVNTTGQKKAAAGIQLLSGNAHVQSGPEPRQFSRQSDKVQQKKTALTKFDTCRLSGFGKGIDDSYSIKNTNPAGIQIGINMNASNELICEAVIPFNSLYISQPSPPSMPQAIFAVGFLIPGLPSPTNTPDMGGGGPPPGTTFNGMPPEMGNGSLRYEIQGLFSDTKVWQIVPLAARPVR
jgi:hypothetical protein